jgi:hypothetical protein
MKKIIFLISLLVNSLIFAQNIPQGISHRGTVYNTDGSIVEGDVGIEISILDDSINGTEVYKETFSITTNSHGQYSLNIGQGIPSSPNFDNTSFGKINWGLNLKYLKVKIDPSGGTNYNTIVGSNQLMSVPYALYSLNSQIKVFSDIIELRNAIGSLNEIVYVKGHTQPGDGGEGNFIWKALPVGNAGINDNDGTIIRNNSSPFGWIRLIEDKINVKYFGIKFDNTDVLKIQKAIDFASLNTFNHLIADTPSNIYFRDITRCGSTVFIPAGEYKISSKIVLKHGASIEGDSSLNTILKAENLTDQSMVELDNGQIIGVNLSNLLFDGGIPPNNPSTASTSPTNCMYLKAHDVQNTSTGGLWLSKFKNIKIRNFDGHGIVLEGSGVESQDQIGDYNFTNQGIIFEFVDIARQKDASTCLLIRGMHGQLTFINCGFDGLVYDGSIYNSAPYKTTKYFNVAIESRAVQATLIKFITCTFQYSEYGVYIAYSESITFDNCWFEYLDTGIAAYRAYLPNNVETNPSKCINILNSRFANSSGFGSEWEKVINRNVSGGSCVSVEGGSNVNVDNNYVIVSDRNRINGGNYFIRNYGLDSKINASNNSFQFPALGRTMGIAGNTISITGNILNTSGYKFVSVKCIPRSNSTNNIQEIKSEISAGETITIRATGSGQIKFDNTKNIVFANPTTTLFVLNPKETATFMKIDDGIGPINNVYYNETYQLISVNKTY